MDDPESESDRGKWRTEPFQAVVILAILNAHSRRMFPITVLSLWHSMQGAGGSQSVAGHGCIDDDCSDIRICLPELNAVANWNPGSAVNDMPTEPIGPHFPPPSLSLSGWLAAY